MAVVAVAGALAEAAAKRAMLILTATMPVVAERNVAAPVSVCVHDGARTVKGLITVEVRCYFQRETGRLVKLAFKNHFAHG